MAIVIESYKTTPGGNPPQTLSFTVPTGKSDTVLVVFAHCNYAYGANKGATWDGDSMGSDLLNYGTTNNCISCFMLKSPKTGTHDIVVDSSSSLSITAILLSGVNQTNIYEKKGNFEGTTSPIKRTINTTVPNGLILLFGGGYYNNGAPTINNLTDNGQESIYDSSSSFGAYFKFALGYQPTTSIGDYKHGFSLGASSTSNYCSSFHFIPPVVAPTVTTQSATNIAQTSCTGNGNITATGGANCTRRGFCYKAGTSGDPTTSDSVAYDDGSFGTGAFTKSITGLTAGTNYRVRAYAVNSAGTSYGTTVDVKTLTDFIPRTMWFN